jgi:hypothetical protein
LLFSCSLDLWLASPNPYLSYDSVSDDAPEEQQRPLQAVAGDWPSSAPKATASLQRKPYLIHACSIHVSSRHYWSLAQLFFAAVSRFFYCNLSLSLSHEALQHVGLFGANRQPGHRSLGYIKYFFQFLEI